MILFIQKINYNEIMRYLKTEKLLRRNFILYSLGSLFYFSSNRYVLNANENFNLSNAKPIRLAVERINVYDNYKMPLKDPFVEHRMRRSPSNALDGWAYSVLRPEGLDGLANMTILEASAKLEFLNNEVTLFNLFRDKQKSKITVTLSAKLEIIKERDGSSGYVDVFSSYTQTAPESASVNQLEKVWDLSVSSAIGKFDKEFRKQILDLPQFLI